MHRCIVLSALDGERLSSDAARLRLHRPRPVDCRHPGHERSAPSLAVVVRSDGSFSAPHPPPRRRARVCALGPIQIVDTIYTVMPKVLTEHGKTKNPYPNVDSHSGVLLWHYDFKQYQCVVVVPARRPPPQNATAARRWLPRRRRRRYAFPSLAEFLSSRPVATKRLAGGGWGCEACDLALQKNASHIPDAAGRARFSPLWSSSFVRKRRALT